MAHEKNPMHLGKKEEERFTVADFGGSRSNHGAHYHGVGNYQPIDMGRWSNCFYKDPSVERDYRRYRRGSLPYIRKLSLVILAVILFYFATTIITSQGDDTGSTGDTAWITSSKLGSVGAAFMLLGLLNLDTFAMSWQVIIVVALLAPVVINMLLNNAKISMSSSLFQTDLNLMWKRVANTTFTEVLVATDFPAIGDKLDDVSADAWTAQSMVATTVQYWVSKGMSQSNRIWPPMTMTVALVLRMEFAYSVAFYGGGLLSWYTVHSHFDNNDWSNWKGLLIVCLVDSLLLFACWLSDRLSRQNYLYERHLRLENSQLNQKLDEIEAYNGANDQERAVVSKVISMNKMELHAVFFQDLKLEKVIGAGASGEVIKASYHGTKVVVKRLLRANLTEENVDAFAKEAMLSAGLRHPSIVQFIGCSFETFANVCIVLEWVPRGDLYGVLQEQGLELTWNDPLLKMAVDTACGVAYLHSTSPPVIHRDLKSLNILVTSTFGCKITDFGMSRQSAARTGQDMVMTMVGTPLWVPPEVIMSQPYCERVDVFSFGIVLCEMASGEMPYKEVALRPGMTKFKLLDMIANEGLRPKIPDGLNQSLRTLIDKCLQKDPNRRPAIIDVVEDLQTSVRRALDKETMEKRQREDYNKPTMHTGSNNELTMSGASRGRGTSTV
jgi:tRNA A-37 threonylcarbamoyl transferase component Bud32